MLNHKGDQCWLKKILKNMYYKAVKLEEKQVISQYNDEQKQAK